MKMNYRQRNNRGEGNARFIVLVFLFAVLLFGLLFRTSSNRAVIAVFTPFWKISAVIEGGLGRLVEPLSFKETLVGHNEALQNEVSQLQEKLLDFQKITSENELLNKELGRKPSSSAHLAAIILQPPRAPYDTFILDQGTEDGVSVGDEVVAGDGALIGSIAEVGAHYSKASLFSTSGIETKGIIPGQTIPVSLTGTDGGDFEVKIPQEISVAVGDPILSLSQKFSLAKVGSVEADGESAYRRVRAQSGINLSTLRSVFIIPSNAALLH